MFALLTLNFNRISVHELGALAVIVATLIGLHHILSPFQIFWGRLADRYPLWGYRRTPYALLGALIGSLVFLALPSLAVGLGANAPWVLPVAFVLFVVFGMAMAANGTATFALISEATTERERGVVVALGHTLLVVSAIVTAGVARAVLPEYSPEQMQVLYNLTPLITLLSALPILGVERRISRAEHAALLAQPVAQQPDEGPFRIAYRLLQTNRQVRSFFLFMLLSITGIFLQDAILEIFGGEVFDMTPAQTSSFTQTWGGGVLLGMLGIGIATMRVPISKKLLATVGGYGTAAGLALVAASSLAQQAAMVHPALLLMGLSVGVFNIGALSLMMEMTVEGYTGLYMGIWGMAQGVGNGLANILSGALHTALIETHLLTPVVAYGCIFGLEAVTMVLAVLVLRGISVQQFKGLEYTDLPTVMALDAA
jgi:BCD family chlorophyll transporter-like MFS transporter